MRNSKCAINLLEVGSTVLRVNVNLPLRTVPFSCINQTFGILDYFLPLNLTNASMPNFLSDKAQCTVRRCFVYITLFCCNSDSVLIILLSSPATATVFCLYYCPLLQQRQCFVCITVLSCNSDSVLFILLSSPVTATVFWLYYCSLLQQRQCFLYITVLSDNSDSVLFILLSSPAIATVFCLYYCSLLQQRQCFVKNFDGRKVEVPKSLKLLIDDETLRPLTQKRNIKT